MSGRLAPNHDSAESSSGIRAGLRWSVASIVWTVVASTTTIVAGIFAGSVLLVAFGAVGAVDLAGSVVLVAHLRHALRHEAIHPARERAALLGIAIAMGAVAIATIVMSTLHLLDHAKAHTSVIGTTVAALSIVVLGTLARGKTRIGRDIGSRALVADGHLSLIGAVLATVTTAGTIATAAFGWWWLDAIASIAVACIAAGVAFDHARHAASAPNELA